MADAAHGGSRARAGRKPGSKNKLPSKSTLAQAKFTELVSDKLEDYFNVLHGIAMNTEERAPSRIAAVKELLDRGLGRSKEIIEISASEDTPADAVNLLALWATTQAAPPIVRPDHEDDLHEP